MNKYQLTISVFISVWFLSCNREPAVDSITENDLQIQLEFIASDEMKGREAGSPEAELTAAYIITELKKLGIYSGNKDSAFIQHVDNSSLMGEKYEGDNYIQVVHRNDEDIYINDIIVKMFPPEKELKPSDTVIFAGLEIDFSVKNNFAEKTIIIYGGKPGEEISPETFQPDFEYSRLVNLYKLGANSVIWAFNPKEVKTGFRKFMSMVKYSDDSLKKTDQLTDKISSNTVFMTKSSVENILKLSEIQCGSKIITLDDIKVGIQVNRKKTAVNMNNVIACIEGSDPDLKNEYIVYVAHYDHLGYSNGHIYNGADDNGSGSVALLEIAEAYMSSPVRPQRSIVFLWVDGEETGLTGSKYYTSHPTFPIDRIKLCINLDMIGRSMTPSDTGLIYGRKVDVQEEDSLFINAGNLTNELLKIQVNECKNAGLSAKYISCKSKANSDHYPFYEKGIPVLFYSTGLHPQYHGINDDTDKISYTKIERIARMAFLVGYRYADN